MAFTMNESICGFLGILMPTRRLKTFSFLTVRGFLEAKLITTFVLSIIPKGNFAASKFTFHCVVLIITFFQQTSSNELAKSWERKETD